MTRERLAYLAQQVASENDQSAFEEIHRAFFPGLMSYCVSILNDKQWAEEIIEDVFVNLWGNRKTIQTIKNISTYLYIAVKHASLNKIKSKSYNIHRMETELKSYGEDYYQYNIISAEEKLINKENLRLVNDVIEALPPKCRLVFRLIKEDGLKYKEVADLLDISPKTVHNHLTKAIYLIVNRLKNTFPEYSLKSGSKK